MEHFVRIVMEKDASLNKLDESILPNNEIYESAQGATVIEIPLARQLDETEATEYANRLANYMFEQGYEDFDIEVSTDLTDDLEEETYDDDDEFYEEPDQAFSDAPEERFDSVFDSKFEDEFEDDYKNDIENEFVGEFEQDRIDRNIQDSINSLLNK